MTKAELGMREKEPQQDPKKSKVYPRRAGEVFAYRGEPTAEEMRKLRWELTPAERKVVHFVMKEEIDYIRNMTPEQSAERVNKIRASLRVDVDETD